MNIDVYKDLHTTIDFLTIFTISYCKKKQGKNLTFKYLGDILSNIKDEKLEHEPPTG